eukprot:Skav229829  [mRNA]  locus=scaffold2672:313332:313574:- [translate_table: standard]
MRKRSQNGKEVAPKLSRIKLGISSGTVMYFAVMLIQYAEDAATAAAIQTSTDRLDEAIGILIGGGQGCRIGTNCPAKRRR